MTSSLRSFRKLLFLFALAGGAHADLVLISENFGGDTSTLNNTAPDTLHSSITAAGGTGTWLAQTGYTTAGATPSDGLAAIYLGALLTDSFGDADAIFTATATIAKPSGSWTAFGFLAGMSANPTLGEKHSGAGDPEGFAWALYRSSNNMDYYKGPTTGTNVDAGNSSGGDVTFTITLDFTPTYYNGTTTFGRAVLSNSDTATVATYDYTSAITDGANTLNGIGFSTSGGTGQLKSFELIQVGVIPEPGTLTLLATALGALLRFRRR